jgi:hypothetical protein
MTDLLACSVLRCQNAGSTTVANDASRARTGAYSEGVVCEVHNAEIASGALWDMDDGRVLIGQDMAPQITRWEVQDSVGSPGLTLALETGEESKPFRVFLTPEMTDRLLMFLRSRGTKDAG